MKTNIIVAVFVLLYFVCNLSNAKSMQLEYQSLKITEHDGAADAIAEAQEKPLTPTKGTADEQIANFMNSKDWKLGWDEDENRFFSLGIFEFNCENPSYDDTFVTRREVACKAATLKAKAEIIEYINTGMSAMDKMVTPGTDVYGELNEKYDNAIKKIEAQKRQIIKLAKELEFAEMQELNGVGWSDRLETMMDGLIKRIDEEYDKSNIEADQRAKLEKVKTRYAEAAEDLKRLESDCREVVGEKTMEFYSVVETLASRTLHGSVCIAQAESWDEKDEMYQVAVLLCWSSKLEKAALAILEGKKDYAAIPSKPSDKSVYDWLKSQNLTTMIGSRQYLDGDGNRHFIGIASRLLGKTASQKEKARGVSEMFAKQAVVYCLKADFESHKKAEQYAVRRTSKLGEKENMEVAESLATEVSQSVKNMQVKGMQKLLSTDAIHPISQQKMYVCVYGISEDGSHQANSIKNAAKPEPTAQDITKSSSRSGSFIGDVNVSDDF